MFRKSDQEGENLKPLVAVLSKPHFVVCNSWKIFCAASRVELACKCFCLTFSKLTIIFSFSYRAAFMISIVIGNNLIKIRFSTSRSASYGIAITNGVHMAPVSRYS